MLQNTRQASPWVSSQTHLLFSTPKISKMMSSNMVQEKAKVTEKITWTTYCRTCNGENEPETSGISIPKMATWYPSGSKNKSQGTMARNWVSCFKAPYPLSKQEETNSLLETRGRTPTLLSITLIAAIGTFNRDALHRRHVKHAVLCINFTNDRPLLTELFDLNLRFKSKIHIRKNSGVWIWLTLKPSVT